MYLIFLFVFIFILSFGQAKSSMLEWKEEGRTEGRTEGREGGVEFYFTTDMHILILSSELSRCFFLIEMK